MTFQFEMYPCLEMLFLCRLKFGLLKTKHKLKKNNNILTCLDVFDIHMLQSITGSSVWNDGKDKSDPSSQPTTWNIDVFVEVVKDLAPHLHFRDVIHEMDHPGFLLKDVQGLRIVKNAFLRGLLDVFPVEVLYRVWKSTDGQVMPSALRTMQPL